ncbi:uncharacterized protein B0H18DRAFT_1119871 [Fomitopsis serialis]|uniref:uncharacterized protein n=1 Tax=Fomitopsis serialis TaxID=139415 RepID=UPI00200856A7|nr:uncharacterized protein B0H18DRAFT_1119871 [Neoantrodia serialis]KAH9924535.1 hypothetical protein B0H18DRAFT_1119871 [Neoantrodia serialis]
MANWSSNLDRGSNLKQYALKPHTMLINANALLVFVLAACAAAPGALADYPTSWRRADVVDTDIYARLLSDYVDYVRRTDPPPYDRPGSPHPPPQYPGGTKPSTQGGSNLPTVNERKHHRRTDPPPYDRPGSPLPPPQYPSGTKPSTQGGSNLPSVKERKHHRRTDPPPYDRPGSPHPPPQYPGGTKPSTQGGSSLPTVNERKHHGKRAMWEYLVTNDEWYNINTSSKDFVIVKQTMRYHAEDTILKSSKGTKIDAKYTPEKNAVFTVHIILGRVVANGL